jgi:CheY-like chemotaxis protein
MDNERLILIVEDTPEDFELLKIAIRKSGKTNPIQIVSDGREAIDYLCGSGKYADRELYPFPGVLFLDLKLPRMDGFDVLKWLKDHEHCKTVPVMVLTSSALERDVTLAYQLGANCYMVKPQRLDDLVRMVDLTFRFWSLCALPTFPVKC